MCEKLSKYEEEKCFLLLIEEGSEFYRLDEDVNEKFVKIEVFNKL